MWSTSAVQGAIFVVDNRKFIESIMSTIASYSTVGSTPISSTTDCHHPYYLHPSDNPKMQLITVMLTESNYNH